MESVLRDGIRALDAPGIVDHVLERLTDTFDASNAMVFSPMAGPCAASGIHYQWGLPATFFDDFVSWVWKLDVWGPVIERRRDHGAVEGVLSQDLVPRSELVETPFYADYLRPLGNMQHMMSVFVGTPGDGLAFSLMRDGKKRPFSSDDLACMQQMRLPLEAMIRGREAVRSSQERARDGALLLDAQGAGLMMLDAGGLVLASNRSASDWLDFSEKTGVVARPLSLVYPALWDACVQARAASGQVFVLPALRGSEVSDVHIEWRESPSVARRIFVRIVREPPDRLELRVERYARANGLSEMEAIVLGELVDRAPADVARHLGIKVSTVRTHLSSIFFKTGKKRQSELLWALAVA